MRYSKIIHLQQRALCQLGLAEFVEYHVTYGDKSIDSATLSVANNDVKE